MRMLFVDYTSAFNTTVPSRQVSKTWVCMQPDWILTSGSLSKGPPPGGEGRDFPLSLRTGAPQGCVLRPLLDSLYTQDCAASHP